MKIYLAPMEGITGEVYRRAYHTFLNQWINILHHF